MKHCPKCNNLHSKLGLFCSRTCANSRGPRTEEFKRKVSQKLLGRKGFNKNKGKFLVERINKKCPQCQKDFLTTLSENRKYCSNACWKEKSGGYRPGSGRAKSGYYKGIYCGSTYELAWLIYRIDHKLPFERFQGVLEHEGIKYIPDFIVGNTIIEIKGYESTESVDKKSNVATKLGYNILVLRKENLAVEFDWAEKNYQYKELYELYDGYKPKYTLYCSSCNSSFARNSKPKTEIVFCSRFCAGKGHKGRVKSL